MTYLEFMIKNVKNVWKKNRLNCEFIGFKNGRLNHKCKECKKSYAKVANGSTKIVQLYINFAVVISISLRKGIYPYQYMDSWERFDENTIPPKEAFYSELNLENITDKDYEHVKKVWEAFEIKNFDEYHDLNDPCDTFLFADVFENFRNKRIEIYGLDPSHFFVCARVSMASMFKKYKNKIRIINRY